LSLAALVAPSELADRILAEVERQANAIMPVAERPARIAALEAELETLAYLEEALVEQALAKGEAIERRSEAPAWAILGVKIVTAKAVERKRVA
jgi:hypothetical protein